MMSVPLHRGQMRGVCSLLSEGTHDAHLPLVVPFAIPPPLERDELDTRQLEQTEHEGGTGQS